ncbi:MAG: UDP-N-acetylmuramoyl-tripeptide--D-alanyl-D-alanine ligase [Aeromicrobium sp.]|uniref:UDP-N-acetylmuramoyl-tripeptide--D-alanyl-D- alanine ligase n=1 Tax=Aeromicrobium sp. TaxID=1871063 RepID=UPI0039E314B3
MIALTAARIAEVVGGRVVGDDTVLVTAPAVIDSRQAQGGSLFVALVGEHADGHDFIDAAASRGATAALAEREVDSPIALVVVDDAQAALGRLARHVHRQLTAAGLTTLALTGSAGKTSTKDLLAHIVEAHGPAVAPTGSFNNELGVPLTVLRATEQTRYLVIEMGARGIGHVAALCEIAPPDVASVLNVGTAHVGEFGGVEQIARAKGEIVEALGSDGVAVLNADDPRVLPMSSRTRGRVVTFGTADDADVRLAGLTLDERGFPELLLTRGEESVQVVLPQPGLHHGANAAAAVAMAESAGVPFADAVASLASATARSPHRMARYDLHGGATVVDDAYNANPESMRAALGWLAEAAPGRGIAVLGAMLELGDDADRLHRELGIAAAGLGLRELIAIGEQAAPMADGAGRIGHRVADVGEAVERVRAALRPGDVVLVKASRGCRLERVVDALREPTGHTAQ